MVCYYDDGQIKKLVEGIPMCGKCTRKFRYLQKKYGEVNDGGG